MAGQFEIFVQCLLSKYGLSEEDKERYRSGLGMGRTLARYYMTTFDELAFEKEAKRRAFWMIPLWLYIFPLYIWPLNSLCPYLQH